MESLQKALANLRAYYKYNGGPNYTALADSTGLSESTVQRYLGQTLMKSPNYSSIISLAGAIGMETADLSLNRDLVDQMEKQQLADIVLELRKINVDELAANDAKWRERIAADQDAHRDDLRRANASSAEHLASVHKLHAEQIAHIHESYRAQMEQMRKASEQQLAHALDAQRSQSLHVQQENAAQIAALKDIAATQKEADEKSKDYLRRQVFFWRVFSLLILSALILLLIADVTNPTRGWIRFISDSLKLSYHTFG